MLEDNAGKIRLSPGHSAIHRLFGTLISWVAYVSENASDDSSRGQGQSSTIENIGKQSPAKAMAQQ